MTAESVGILSRVLSSNSSACPSYECDSFRHKSIAAANDGPAVVSLISSSCSMISSLVIIFTYFKWADIRSASRQIIVFLSLADFFTAMGYVIGSSNYFQYYHNFDSSNHNESYTCEQFTRVCVLQSCITTWSSMASFWWSTFLAFHLYITVVKGKAALAGKLFPVYHTLAWITPTIIVIVLLSMDKLGYSSVAVSTWCFVRGQSHRDEVLLILIGGKLWEVAAYIAVVLFYCLTKLHIHRETKAAANRMTLSVGVMAAIQQVDRKLIFIPVVFLLLRIWGTVQFIVSSSIHKDSHNCVSHPAFIVLYILSYLQGIGDGGQGWGNFILYVFTTKQIRERLFYCCHKSPAPESSAIQHNRYNQFYNTT